MPTTRNVAILIFEDVEVLDFCGPFEVFSVANRFTDPPAFHVFAVAEKAGPEKVDRPAGDVARKGKIGNLALVPLWTARLTEPHTAGTAVAPDSHAYGAFQPPRRRKKLPK
jgi:hypothetical protein